MKKSRERRVHIRLPVRVWGLDLSGKLFDLRTHTVNITPVGACIEGILITLQRGALVGVESGQCRAHFRVSWVGRTGTPRAGQIGVHCIEPGKYIWGVALERGHIDEEPPSSPMETQTS